MGMMMMMMVIHTGGDHGPSRETGSYVVDVVKKRRQTEQRDNGGNINGAVLKGIGRMKTCTFSKQLRLMISEKILIKT